MNRGIEIARSHNDNGSRHLLEEMLVSEEEHLDWIEAQQTLIAQVGEANYLSQQIRS
jgi:bacterioferritin